MNRYSYCNQKTSDNFTAVLIHVKSGYLPPVDFNTVQTEKPQAAKPAYDPEKTKNLLEKINAYLKEKFQK